MKYIISKTYKFEAAHRLPLVPDGHKCKKTHGHSYKISFFISSNKLISGMVCDFSNISLVVKGVIKKQLDHQLLNDITGLENPTAENIASWCANLFCHEFRMNYYRVNHPYYKDRKDQALKLEAVEVQETDTSFCRIELQRHL